MNEADACRKLVVPKLQAAGWETEPHSIAEQRTITDGRIVPTGKGFIRRPPKRVDYLLRYTRDFPLAVIEAKADYKLAADGLQQAKDYATLLGLKFAYATNGQEIVEFDFLTGLERNRTEYPAPEDLWARYRAATRLSDPQADQLLVPFNHVVGKGERYYQQIAVNRVVEAILTGRRRLLVTMATGTGKTAVAFQICWKLWTSRWNRTGEHRRPRILYLADRNILIDQPKDGIFAEFGDARCKIESGEVVKSREMYFGIYQALAEDERRVGLFRSFLSDFFDFVIVDECHRGSARDESSWRVVLEHFQPAVQLGMTATPLREETRDTYLYFGDPIYQYSLRQGIDDGFLAPYRVHRVITEWDAAGWRPSKDELDRYGRSIPDDEYHTKDFERLVALRARIETIARHLTQFLEKTDRFAKTIVFCVDQEHASEMGYEPKSLPYLLCQMNLLLHGLDAPQIDPGNALRHKLSEIGEKERVDVILTNPPFGGEEEKGIQGNFPDDRQTSETALLFLQLIMRKLHRRQTPVGRPARAAVVVPNGTLFGDGVCARIKEELLKEFNLHTIVRLPNGVFAPYTPIPTNLLFFDRSGPTQEVWYYEHPLPEGRKNYTKTVPLQFEEFAPCQAWWTERQESERAWTVPAAELLAANCNLDRKNPRAKEDIAHLPPEQIAASILEKEQRIAEIMQRIQKLLAEGGGS